MRNVNPLINTSYPARFQRDAYSCINIIPDELFLVIQTIYIMAI